MAYGPNFFDPNNSYGGAQDWASTPFVNQYLDPQIPQGVYTGFLANNGFGGFNRQNDFARSLYGQTQTGYQAATRQNPALSYLDYLNQQFGGGGLQNMWNSSTPEQRGEQSSRWSGPTRFIGWG
jgi:hypothetical protein